MRDDKGVDAVIDTDDYQKLEEAKSVETVELKLVPASTIMKETFRQAGTNSLAFTYSLQLPMLLAVLAGVYNQNNSNTQSLAAASLAIPYYDTGVILSMVSSFSGLFVGGSLYTELQNPGTSPDRKKEITAEISSLIKNLLLLSSPFTALMMATFYFSESLLIHVCRQDPEIAALVRQFLRPATGLLPFFALRFSFQQIFFLHQKQGRMTTVSLISFLLLGVFLLNALGFGYLSVPQMGIWGVILALLLENFVSTLGAGLCLFAKDFKDYRFAASFLHWGAEDKQQLLKLVGPGIMVEVTYLSELLTLFSKNALAGNISNNALGAQNFAGQVLFFILFIAHAFSQAVVQCMISAKGDHNRNRYAQYGLLSAILASLIPAIILCAYPQILTMIFGDSVSDDVLSLAHPLTQLAAGTSVFYTAALTMMQSFRNIAGYVKPTAVFNAWLWMSVLASYLLAFPGKLGVMGIGVGSLFGTAGAAGHLWVLWKTAFLQNTQQKKLQLQKPPEEKSAPKEPVRVSSSWFSCFRRPCKKLCDWYYGSNAQPSASP